jgi:hypothetical protein
MDTTHATQVGNDWLNLEEACALLRRKYKGVRRLIEAGEIYRDPHHGRILISRASIEAYSHRQTQSGLTVAA